MIVDQIEFVDVDSQRILLLPACIVVKDLKPRETGLLKGFDLILRIQGSHKELKKALDGLE